ncbi:MAG: hypothetical protein GY953_35615, partial [bacterium]|nr:hypothetical protein [bacterium]
VDGDPNPGTAIRVHSDGRYELTNAYYFYKQLTAAGHRGQQPGPHRRVCLRR